MMRRIAIFFSVVAILNSVDSQRWKIWGNVDSVISKSGLVGSVGVEVEIASLSQPTLTGRLAKLERVQICISVPLFAG